MKYRSMRFMNRAYTLVAGLALSSLYFVSPAFAQEPIVYPAQGQSPAKMGTDKAECQAWATQQTGFDPLRAAQAPSAAANQPERGGVLRGGARGAAAGAAIGAIAGDAGKGAEIGAATGGLGGAARKRRQHRQAQQEQAQQSQAQSQQMDMYLRAFGACLKGRGYTVE